MGWKVKLLAAGFGAAAGAVLLVAVSDANRTQPDSTPRQIDALVPAQIVAMMSLERAVLDTQTTNRFSGIGGMRLSSNRSFPVRGLNWGAGIRAAADAEATRLALAGQETRANSGISPTLAFLSPQILDAMPAARGDAQWKCLSEALYFEARGEDIWGQFAVAEVILNRVESPRFPDSVCRVVQDGTGQRNKCQFSYMCDGKAEDIRNSTIFARLEKIAALMLDGRARILTDGATFYHTKAVAPRWVSALEETAVIGDHIFYRYP